MYEQRALLENHSLTCISDVVDFQAILGEMSEDVKSDFLAGSNGACKLTETELANLDTIYECVDPAQGDNEKIKLSERAKAASKHLVALVDGKKSSVVEGGVSYKDIRAVLEKIRESGYFDKVAATEEVTPAKVPAVEEQKPEEAIVAEESPEQQEQPPQQVLT